VNNPGEKIHGVVRGMAFNGCMSRRLLSSPRLFTNAAGSCFNAILLWLVGCAFQNSRPKLQRNVPFNRSASVPIALLKLKHL
jgi:hypothetical protein